MKIKILKSFADARAATAFRPKEIVTVPDAVAQDWIEAGLALAVNEEPVRAARETAVRKAKEHAVRS